MDGKKHECNKLHKEVEEVGAWDSMHRSDESNLTNFTVSSD